MKRFLTGVKPTGIPHLGNYIGAMKPILSLAEQPDAELFCFIPDAHALTTPSPLENLKDMSYTLAATWLALGLNSEKVHLYRQSQVPEVFELTWVLTCLTPKGLMNRAHAYKAARQENDDNGLRGADADIGILMGVYVYPILMAADILLFQASHVPVGRDQVQHVEMARDIAIKFNQTYGEAFILPEAMIQTQSSILKGLDGRKMSKSYGNTIPLFLEKEALLKHVRRIKTNSQEPGEPKDTEACTLFQIYEALAPSEDVDALRKRYQEGIGWGEAKAHLFEFLEAHFKDARERFIHYRNTIPELEALLKKGEARVRTIARETMGVVRQCIGF